LDFIPAASCVPTQLPVQVPRPGEAGASALRQAGFHLRRDKQKISATFRIIKTIWRSGHNRAACIFDSWGNYGDAGNGFKAFEEPDEVRTFEKGKFELVRIGSMTIGRATYEPGWKWSVHVGPLVGASRCNVEHVGMVLSGCATAAMEDGTIHELRAGTVFYIPPGPPGHDSWVVGDAPYVSLHFMGTEQYASK